MIQLFSTFYLFLQYRQRCWIYDTRRESNFDSIISHSKAAKIHIHLIGQMVSSISNSTTPHQYINIRYEGNFEISTTTRRYKFPNFFGSRDTWQNFRNELNARREKLVTLARGRNHSPIPSWNNKWQFIFSDCSESNQESWIGLRVEASNKLREHH